MSPPPAASSLRRTFLPSVPSPSPSQSQSQSSEAEPSRAEPAPVTVSLPPRMDHSFRGAASRQLPPPPPRARIGGADTPPVAASGTNRVAVIERRRISSALALGRSGHAHAHTHPAYQKPFPVPRYLLHSTYAAQFFTTPVTDSPFVHLSPDGFAAPDARAPPDDLCEALGGADLRLGAPGANGTILLPTCWDVNDRCALIELSSDGLGVSFGGSAKYGDRDAASVRSNRPIPPQAAVYYYEVTVENRGVSGYIGIGLSHRSVSLSRLPGWEASSWGYHGDDGRAFCCLGTGSNFGPTFTTGDVIGCGVDYSGASPEQTLKHASGESHRDGGRAFFTKNGEFLGYAFSNLHGKLYPSVGLRTPGEVVRTNFGSEPFAFDIDSLVRERKRAVLAQVHATEIPPSLLLPSPLPTIPSLLPTSKSEQLSETLQDLITSYLVHHGYTATADTFASQVTLERRERARGLIPSATDDDSSMTTIDAVASTSASGSDSSVRGEIRQAFLAGDPDRALELTEGKYPTIFQHDDADPSGGLRFKLRTRAFVEAVIRALPGDEAPPPASAKGKAKAIVQDDVQMDDLEDHFTTPPASPLFGPADPIGLDVVLSLGKALNHDYRDDERPGVREAMEQVFSLMAYSRLGDFEGPLAWLVSMGAREALADELNSAILVSLSLPPIPDLEAIYRHTSALVSLLGDSYELGGAAFVNVKGETVAALS